MHIVYQWKVCGPNTPTQQHNTGRALLQLLQQWGALDYNGQPHDFCVRKHFLSIKNNTVCDMPGM